MLNTIPHTPQTGAGAGKPAQAALPYNLPRHWFLFRLSSLGDVALLTGPMRYWHDHWGWSFTIMTKPAFAPLFENNPAVESIICPEKSKLSLPGMPAYFNSLAHAFAKHGLLDLHGTTRSRLLSALWRGPVRRYPKFSLQRRLLVLNKSPKAAALLRASTVTQRYFMAVAPTPPPPEALLPVVYLTRQETEAAQKRLESIFGQEAFRNGPVRPIALHPYATHFRKAWPKEHWLHLVNRLDEAGRPWFIVGQGEALLPQDRRDLTGKTGLRELCALLSQASVLMTGDSGPMHLAAAVGTPVLALFGPTTREWGFFPAGPQDVILQMDMPCRPCSLHGADRCKTDGCCLKGIAPQDALRQLELMLAGL